MPITTKPCEAILGPSHARLDQLAVYPGEMAIAPNVPWLVSSG